MSIFKQSSTIKPEPIATPPAATPPAPVKTSTGSIKGIDIYHGDEFTGWNSLIAQGFYFAFMKATEGTGIKDSRFDDYWTKAKSAGIIRGAYHFFRSNQDPVAQAEAFFSMVGPLEVSDLPMVLDWEYADGNPSNGDDIKAKAFLEKIEALSEKIPLIYTNAYIPNFFNNPAWMARYPLWLAAYRSTQPTPPKPWTRNSFWQYTGTGTPVSDLNVFNGSLDDLKLLAKG